MTTIATAPILADEIQGDRQIKGWERIISEGHMWVERIKYAQKAKLSFLPADVEHKLRGVAAILTTVVFVSASLAGLTVFASKVKLDSDKKAPTAYVTQIAVPTVAAKIKLSDNTATGITKQILEGRDAQGRVIAVGVVEDYIAGKANQGDFSALSSFSDGWAAGKVGVIKTDKGNWFGFRFRAVETASSDNLAVIFVPAGGKPVLVAGDLMGIERYPLAKMPREAVKVGLATAGK